MIKYASFEDTQVLDLKGSANRIRQASLDKIGEYDDYRTQDGFLYARIRAISSRRNRNDDIWPSVELAGSQEIMDQHLASAEGFTVEADSNQKFGYSTFLGKPVFVDHNNSNPERARGVVVDSKLHVEDSKTAAQLDPYYADAPDYLLPPTWVELLLEVDAKSFPKLAKAIIDGSKDSGQGIDGFSMGCFISGTPITLADGTHKPIEAIEEGDEVLTHTGGVEKVTHTMKRLHKGVIYSVDIYGQTQPLTMTEEHPIWVRRGDTEQWVEAQDLKKGDLVLTPSPQDDGHPGTYSFARLLGYYLAEGNLGYDRKRFSDGSPSWVEWNFHEDEIEYINEVKTLIEESGYRPAGPYVKNHCASIRCNSPEFARKFKDYGGSRCDLKQLHPETLQWEQENQRALLFAYFNGDGHFEDNHVQAGTASQKLAQQLHLLALRCEIPMTPPGSQHSPSARDAGKKPKYVMQAVLDRPQIKYGAKVEAQGLWRRVTGIGLREYDGYVYNFDVDGDDSYVAGNVAVHNCDIERSVCNICKNSATMPDEFCKHIKKKGQSFPYIDDRTGKKNRKKSGELCHGIRFFELSAVFEPADETALTREVIASVHKEGETDLPQAEKTKVPEEVNTLREEKLCPVCGTTMESVECPVCGHVEEPEGFGNPDLEKAQENNQDLRDQQNTPEEGAGFQGLEDDKMNLPPAQKPMKDTLSHSLTNDNRSIWSVKLGPKEAGQINRREFPISPNRGEVSDRPDEVVIKDSVAPILPSKRPTNLEPKQPDQEPKTSAVRKQRRPMSNQRNAADPLPAARPDVSTEVDQQGGVMDSNNESASQADSQVTVSDVGSTPTDNVSSDETNSVDQGNEYTKNVEQIPTKTFPDTDQHAPVGNQPFPPSDEGVKKGPEPKRTNWHVVAYGPAVEGVQPGDPVGTADQRVDVTDVDYDVPLQRTETWTGTDGNGVLKQQDPTTNEPWPASEDGVQRGSHVRMADLQLVDREIEMGMTDQSQKYARIAELAQQSEQTVSAYLDQLNRVRTAGLAKNSAPQKSMRMPALGKAASKESSSEDEDYLLDSAVFSK